MSINMVDKKSATLLVSIIDLLIKTDTLPYWLEDGMISIAVVVLNRHDIKGRW